MNGRVGGRQNFRIQVYTTSPSRDLIPSRHVDVHDNLGLPCLFGSVIQGPKAKLKIASPGFASRDCATSVVWGCKST
jgi:hypothetical protein